MAATKPALLYVLAAFGLVIGLSGALYSMTNASAFLISHDQFVAAHREELERGTPGTPPVPVNDPGRVELNSMVERWAEATYARRGVVISLAAMNVIVSLLLFAGCARALRGDAWGVSAWMLAAAVSVPYTLLDCAFAFVQRRDLSVVFNETAGPLGLAANLEQSIKTLLIVFKAAVEIIYFVACVLYLRRPSLKKYFVSDG